MKPGVLRANDGARLAVDLEFWPLLLRHTWFPIPLRGSPSVYAASIRGAHVYLAHLIFGQVARGPQRKVVLSFIDQDPRNCRLKNLVPMDLGLSRQRARQPKRGGVATSSYRGVIRDPRTGRYRASIGINYRRVYLGTFEQEEDAARAYDAAALAHHGARAVLNFPT